MVDHGKHHRQQEEATGKRSHPHKRTNNSSRFTTSAMLPTNWGPISISATETITTSARKGPKARESNNSFHQRRVSVT